MTSTPLAPRSVSTPTHKDQREAWPCHSCLSPSLFLFCLSICLSLPSPPEGGGRWRLGPSPLLMSLVRHMTMSSGGDVTQASSVTSSISDEKQPLYLSHGWCYGYNYGSYIIIDTSCLVLIVVLAQFVESEVAVVIQLFFLLLIICI